MNNLIELFGKTYTIESAPFKEDYKHPCDLCDMEQNPECCLTPYKCCKIGFKREIQNCYFKELYK